MPNDSHSDPAELATIITAPPAGEASVRPIGSFLGGRFRVLNVFGGPGSSGMGIVYIVDDGQRTYAAKTYQHRFSNHLSFIERFVREARTWMLTGFHPNIVHAYFVDIIEAVPYLFMEYIEGDNKGAWSLARRIHAGPIPFRTALDYAIQCCEGMEHAAASVPGLVHRDLKPENLLLTKHGALKITDFGLVRCHATADALDTLTQVEPGAVRSGLTHAGSTMGTPAYMAPEQFVRPDAVTSAADIYAFGCCFYEAFTGQRIFTIRVDTPVEHLVEMRDFHLNQYPARLGERVPGCPPEVDEVIMACLEKDPRNRPADFGAIRARLIGALESLTQRRYSSRLPYDPTPREVADQVKSLSLLDGYVNAIRRQSLRNSQFVSPYSFHLALASYFHVNDNRDEERRQLEKAAMAHGTETGHEVARRLSDLFVASGDWEGAARTIETFIESHPDETDSVLEPYVRLLIRNGDYGRAEQLLEEAGRSVRTMLLRLELYNAANRSVDAAALLYDALGLLIERLRANIARLKPGVTAAWDSEGDWDTLCAALAELDPGTDTSPVRHAAHCVWPELDGYPDFSADMAWLSQVCGELAALGEAAATEDRDRFAACARLLDYPNRLRRHLMRDEHWIWANTGPIAAQKH